MNIFVLIFAIASCDLEFYDDAEVEFTTHLLTTTESTTLTTPFTTISSSISSSSTSITPDLTSKAVYEGSGNSTEGSSEGDEDATSNKSKASSEVDVDQNKTTNNSDYEDMNIKILNEPFKDEDLLRKALEMSLQDLIAKNLEKISQLYPTDRKKAILPTTKPSVSLTTEFALKVSTTLSTSVDHQQIGHQRKTEKDSEVLDLIGEDVIGNFDQIIIDQDQDGAIIVTKKKKLFANTHDLFQNDEAGASDNHVGSIGRSPLLLKIAPDANREVAVEINDDLTKNDNTDQKGKNGTSGNADGHFIQNEQLITICLAALGVTSTGLLMWIAIQHLYGMYTDFKKTINPIQYYDSNNDDFDCDGSIISARMADRPPTYNASQRQNYEQTQPSYVQQSSSYELPPYTEQVQINPEPQQTFNVDETPSIHSSSISYSSENDSVRRYEFDNVSLPERQMRTDISSVRPHIGRFCERRRLNSESNHNGDEIYDEDSNDEHQNETNLFTPKCENIVCLPRQISLGYEGESSLSRTVSVVNDDDFDSAPELAELELIHKILKKTKRSRNTHPKRSATISHISEGNSTSRSIYLNVQIAIDPIGSLDPTREITRRSEFLEIEEMSSSEHSSS